VYSHELDVAIEIVSEGSRLARQVQNQIVAAGDSVQKTDRSPVTVADLALQIVAARRLAAAFPTDAMLAEEESSVLSDPEQAEVAEQVLELCRGPFPSIQPEELIESLDRGGHAGGDGGRYWVLDPIDGTKGFLRGEQYAMALALVDKGQVQVGVLGCPNLGSTGGGAGTGRGSLFAAQRGGGAFSRPLDGADGDHPISVDAITDPSQAVICESVEAAHSSHSQNEQIARALGITAPRYRIDSQCKYAVVSRGGASLYLRLATRPGYREKVWDHAAGVVVIEEAGGKVTDVEGRPLDCGRGRYLDRRHGIIATNGVIHDRVLEATRSVLDID